MVRVALGSFLFRLETQTFVGLGLLSLRAFQSEASAHSFDLLLFDQLELFRLALDLQTFEDKHKERALRMQLAEALVSAGRGEMAADAFLLAAKGADPATRLLCERQATQNLLVSGYIDRGVETLRGLLANVGTELQKTPRRALASIIWHRARIVWRSSRRRARRERHRVAVRCGALCADVVLHSPGDWLAWDLLAEHPGVR